MSVGMEDLHVTQVERKHERYVCLFQDNDREFIASFFSKHADFLKKPLLTKDHMKCFIEHFELHLDASEIECKSFEELFPLLSAEFQKKHDIVFTSIEGQNRGYSGLMSMLSSSYDFSSDHPTLEPRSLARRDFNHFLSNEKLVVKKPSFQDVLKVMNAKQERLILGQILSVQVRACVIPASSIQESANILLDLQDISKSWSDEKKSSSSPSASTSMARLFSVVHSFVRETVTTVDGIVYNRHAVLAEPCHRIDPHGIGAFFEVPEFIDYCENPTIPKMRRICTLFQENQYRSLADKDQVEKKPLLPYFLNCANMFQINTVSSTEDSNSKENNIPAFYDASECSIMVTAPIFHRAIWEGINGMNYNEKGSKRLKYYLQKCNRTVWNKSGVNLKVDEKFGEPRPEPYVEVMDDIQCLQFMMMTLTYALSASDENNLQPFLEVIQILDKAEPHVVKVETSLKQYGELGCFHFFLLLFKLYFFVQNSV